MEIFHTSDEPNQHVVCVIIDNRCKGCLEEGCRMLLLFTEIIEGGPVGEQENEQGAQEEQMQGVSGDGFEHEKEDDEHHRYLMDAEMEEQ
eukprot:scaffold47908_cov17-Tisochrysis_lutea.AAC.1